MAKAVEKARRWCAVLVLAGIALGCAAKRDEVAPSKAALSTSNGIGQNGLTTNGLWSNGLWSNGLWSNGLWSNGLWSNGLWSNGLWSNGLWSNGLWSNGLWSNGLWSNGLWSNGLTGDAAVPGDTLRSSPYARQALQYIYACAMPPFTYDTSLDPNGGTLLCASSGDCDDGYTCNAQGRCVVPLVGAIGVGINADGTSWGASGRCDESCQRWVSACVLARTNAYGVHVEISIRAPADAPQAIKDALAVSDVERNGDSTHVAYSLREGAYYGNLFQTTPGTLDANQRFVPMLPPQPEGQTAEVIMATPVFTACAGPGSNIPAITKRFCSSQGDQGVIAVPGVCLATATQQGACDGEDADPTSPTYGAIHDCYTSTDPTQPRTHYDEVLTVYLKTPIAVCGNAVCEEGEDETGCPSDCHPGSWAKDFDPSIQRGFVGNFAQYDRTQFGMSAVAPDGSIAVAGTALGDVSLGGGTLPASLGSGVLAKYRSDGSYEWGVRFGNTSQSAPGGQLREVNGVTVAANGEITVVGSAYELIGGVPHNDIWISKYTASGVKVAAESWSLVVGPISATDPFADSFVQPTRSIAVDSQGNVIMGGRYDGVAIFGDSVGTTSSYLAKVSAQGTLLWSKRIFPEIAGVESVSVDPADNIVMLAGFVGVQKLSPQGVALWTKTAPGVSYTVAAADASGNVYASGFFTDTANFGGGPLTDIRDRLPFLVKYDGAGVYQWVTYPQTLCPPTGCPVFGDNKPPQVWGISIGFESSGDVILAALGTPYAGGGIDFGVGTFPTYGATNIFIASYSRNAGEVRWAKQVPTVLTSSLLAMSVDGEGRVVVGGNYSGSMQVDDRLLVTGVPEDPDVVNSFLASFNGPSTSDHLAPVIGSIAGTADQPGAPANTVPKPIVVPATSAAGATVFFMPPTAIDAGHSGTSVACSPPPNTTFPVGTTTVTCTASDPLGNHATASFTVTVADKLGPVLSPLADITVQATDASPSVVTFAAPTAVDQLDGPVTATCAPASGSVFPAGATTVTCTAKDTRNNLGTGRFTVTVKPPVAPNTPPVVTVPANLTVTATFGSPSAVVTFTAAATDAQDGPLVPACTPASGAPFAIGTTTVSCTATDAGGLSSTKTFTVTVLAGLPPNTPPVVTVPANLTVEATSAAGAKVTFTATATDAQDGARPVTCSPASGTTFAIGTKTVTCTATDKKGLSASKSFTVTVRDSKGPTFCDVPGTVKAYATSKAGAKVTYATPHANDAIDGARPVTCTPASGAQFPINKTTVTCTASDKAGNKATATFTVWVTYQAPTDGTFFLFPVRANGSSVFRIGRPVPARFKLTGASSGITDLAAKLTVTKLSNAVQGTVVDSSDETVDDTDLLFKYRPLLKFYAYRWKTRDQTQGTFQLKVDLGDGVTHQVNVSLRP